MYIRNVYYHGKESNFYKTLVTVKEHKGASPKKISEIAQLSRDTVRYYLILAKKFGFVVSRARGKYEITEAGLKYLEEEEKRLHVCPMCGRTFVPSKHRTLHHNFCSKKCYNAWLRKTSKKYQESLRKCKRNWYLKNREKIRADRFLYGAGMRRGFLNSEGCCVVCGELNPLTLEDEHVFGRMNSDFAITLCGSCHKIRHRAGWEALLKLREIFNEG